MIRIINIHLALFCSWFYDSSFLLCRPLKRYSPSPKTLRSTNSTFTYQSFSLQDSRAIQHCTNIITEGVHRHLTVFRILFRSLLHRFFRYGINGNISEKKPWIVSQAFLMQLHKLRSQLRGSVSLDFIFHRSYVLFISYTSVARNCVLHLLTNAFDVGNYEF